MLLKIKRDMIVVISVFLVGITFVTNSFASTEENDFAESVASVVTAKSIQTINIKGDDNLFDELIMQRKDLDTGEALTYLPVRLAFSNYYNKNEDNDPNSWRTTVIYPYDLANDKVANYDSKMVCISVRKGTVDNPDSRRGIVIDWSDSTKNTYSSFAPNGLLRKFEGSKTDYTEKNPRGYEAIDHKLEFSTVDDKGGQRLFLSTDDFNKVIRWLTNYADYDVSGR